MEALKANNSTGGQVTVISGLAAVLGVRPHYVKAVALRNLFIENKLDVTFLDIQQHYDNELRGVFLGQYGLEVVSLSSNASRCSSSFDFFMDASRAIRDWFATDGARCSHVLVMGDAYPALIGALAASRSGRRIIHIEAGIRREGTESEHWNCALVDLLAHQRFCCLPEHIESLASEGLDDGAILVGDIFAPWLLDQSSKLDDEVEEDSGCCLVTIHRPQNCSRDVIEGILSATRSRGLRVIWVLHPRIASYVDFIHSYGHTTTLPPQGYRDVLRQVIQAGIVITDSGGLARESMILGKRTVIVHEHGMWAEAIRCGAAIRSSGTQDGILNAIDAAMERHDSTLGRQLFVSPGGLEMFVQSVIKEMSMEG